MKVLKNTGCRTKRVTGCFERWDNIMKILTSVFCILAIVFLVLTTGYAASSEQNEKTRYVTWNIWEVDRAASIWLMKSFVNEDAEFIFVEKGASFEAMIPFDVPEAELQRTHNLACYQVILRKYTLRNPRLSELGKLIWDIEINFWGEKKFPESLELKQKCEAIFAENLSPQETLEKCFVIFDAFITHKSLSPSLDERG